MAKTLDITFKYFISKVLTQFAETFSPKNNGTYIHADAAQKFGKDMLTQYDYTPERETFLINATKSFITKELDDSQSHNTCLAFLEQLIDKIINNIFLDYAMAKYPTPMTKAQKKELRETVATELKNKLFNQNSYIQGLRIKQEKKREFRHLSKYERKTIIQEQRQTRAEAAYRITCQTRGMFVAAQNTPRKRR